MFNSMSWLSKRFQTMSRLKQARLRSPSGNQMVLLLRGVSIKRHLCVALAAGLGIFAGAAAAQTNTIFDETYDTANTPAGANALGWSGGGGLSNIVVTYVDGAGVGSTRALVIRADFTQAGSGYVAYQYANPAVSGNPSTNLGDYQLSFDIKVNNSGLSAIQCVLQSWGNTGYGGAFTTTPGGYIPLGSYTTGTFKHISVNLADVTIWSGTNTFNPAGGTWQIQLQVNGWNGAAIHTNEQVAIDNLTVTMSFQTSSQCTVNWNDVHQRIDGFGASSAWTAPSLSDSQADMFFSTNNGIGLSLLRNRIAPDGTTLELVTMQKALARGARVWSTPFSPPAVYKDTNSVNGGDFVSSTGNYQGYAQQLAAYVANMKNSGINLYAVSIQNEPDQWTTYESCLWTAQQFHDFIPYLYNALVASNVASTKILMPEYSRWQFDIATNAMNDTNTSAMVGILAGHNYGSTAAPVDTYGKALWETEISSFDVFDGSITNGIYWAGQIHAFMTVAEVNAWHYYWLIPYDPNGPENLALTDDSGNPTKRMYVLGNYSRFVRPGYYRVGVTNTASSTLISAYKDPASASFAIVAINPNSGSVTQVFNLSGFAASTVTPWLTSGALSLAQQSALAVNGTVFTNVLPALSVSTFVGQAAAPPTLAATKQGINIILSWATNIAGYSLVCSTNLAPAHWNSVLSLPVVVGNQNVVTNSITNGAVFYRLYVP
jgi:glucuronoarabinoxylan endo-1,4-beta-xylanase